MCKVVPVRLSLVGENAGFIVNNVNHNKQVDGIRSQTQCDSTFLTEAGEVENMYRGMEEKGEDSALST